MKRIPLYQITIIFIAISIWLLNITYKGIRHDALLYTIEALAINDPNNFKPDLFLVYGSQGSFTLFPYIYAFLISTTSLDTAAFILTIIGKIFWLIGLIYFARQFLSSKYYYLSIFLILASNPFYDSHHIFSYGESFVTPRIFSEAFSLISLGLLLSNKNKSSFFTAFTALALHPLMGLSTLIMIIINLFLSQKKIRALFIKSFLFFLISFTIATLFQVEPFSKVFQRYDPEWLFAIKLRNLYVFLSNWDISSYGKIIFLINILILSTIINSNRIKILSISVLITTLSFLSLSWIGSDLLNSILLTQLQLWRILWLTQIISLFLIIPVMGYLWQQTNPNKLMAIVLGSAFIFDGLTAGLMSSLVTLSYFLIKKYKLNINLVFLNNLVIILIPLIIIAPLISLLCSQLVYISFNIEILKILTRNQFITILILFFLFKTSYLSKKWQLFTLLISIVLLNQAINYWNQSSSNNFHNKSKLSLSNSEKSIPSGSIILSTSGVGDGWLYLGHAYYASQIQTAGSLFNRKTALEGIRRLTRLNSINFPESELKWGTTNLSAKTYFSENEIDFLCNDPTLDFLLAPSLTRKDEKIQNNTIYNCKKIRQKPL